MSTQRSGRPTACGSGPCPAAPRGASCADELRVLFCRLRGGGAPCLVLQGAHTLRKSVQTDETSGVTLLVYVVLTKRDESLVIKRVLAFPSSDRDVPLEE